MSSKPIVTHYVAPDETGSYPPVDLRLNALNRIVVGRDPRRIRLRDHRGTPLADTPYSVEGPFQSFQAVSDADGFTEPIFTHASEPTLLHVGDEQYELLRILHSTGDRLGAALLNALGFDRGMVSPDRSEAFSHAIARFQFACGLPVSRVLDEETIERLTRLGLHDEGW